MNEAQHLEAHADATPATHTHDDPGIVEHAHPGPSQYVAVALALAVITAVEVAIYYFDLNKVTLVIALLILSATKFALVALFFMHLKFDNRLFSVFFASGLAVTVAAFIAVLAMFHAL